MRKSTFVVFILAFLFIGGCDSNRVFEQHIDIEEGKWAKEDIKTFEIEINDPNKPYDIYYTIRNSVSYPYYNLYLEYTLLDAEGKEISSALQNMLLFDEKSGKPVGSGLGDIFDLQVQALNDFTFPSNGKYNFTIQQFMRNDTLNDILAVGVRVENNKP